MTRPILFQRGLARVRRGDKFGFIDRTGKLVIKAQFDDAGSRFQEGLAAVNMGFTRNVDPDDSAWSLGKWGFIDRTGKFVIPARLYAAEGFNCGTAWAAMSGEQGMIDRKGRWVRYYGNPHLDFHNGLKPDQDSQGLWGYINSEGKQVISPQFTDAAEFSGGLARVHIGNVEAYIDTSGEFVWRFPSDRLQIQQGEAIVHVGLVSKVDTTVEIANVWTTPLIVPYCGKNEGWIELCSEFVRLEQLTSEGWIDAKPAPHCGIVGGVISSVDEYFKRVTLQPGANVYGHYRFNPLDFSLAKGRPLRVVVFVYDVGASKPLSKQQYRTIVSDPFELPKPEWCDTGTEADKSSAATSTKPSGGCGGN